MVEIIILTAALLLTGYLALTYPRYAALLLAGILPSYLLRVSIGPIPTTYFEVSVWTVALGICLRPTSRVQVYEWLKRIPKTSYLAVFGFLLAASISTIISPHPETSLGILKGWIITPLVAGIIIGSTLTSTKDKLTLLKVLITCAVAVSVHALGAPAMNGRLVGVYDTPNSLALFIAPILVAAIWLAIQEKKYRVKIALTISSIILGFTLIGTQSIGGVLSVLGTLIIATTLPSPHRKKITVTILGLFLIAIFASWQLGKIPYLLAPVKDPSTSSSASVRFQLWSIGWELIKENPILGIGLGTFEPAYQAKLHERFALENPEALPEFVFRDPHNWIISFWLNLGLMGLMSFICLSIFVLKRGIATKNIIVNGCMLMVACLLLFGLTDTIYWKNDLASLYWIIVLAVRYQDSKTSQL